MSDNKRENKLSNEKMNKDNILKEIQNMQKNEIDEIASNYNNKKSLNKNQSKSLTSSKSVNPNKSNKCYLKKLNKLGNEPFKFNTTYKKPLYDNKDEGEGDITDTYEGEWNGPNNYYINHKRILKDNGIKCHSESNIYYNYNNDNNMNFKDMQKQFNKEFRQLDNMIEDDLFNDFLF